VYSSNSFHIPNAQHEEGIVVPQLIKGRTTAMYLESQVVKIAKKKVEDSKQQPALRR
jgi:hypothetical protein